MLVLKRVQKDIQEPPRDHCEFSALHGGFLCLDIG